MTNKSYALKIFLISKKQNTPLKIKQEIEILKKLKNMRYFPTLIDYGNLLKNGKIYKFVIQEMLGKDMSKHI